MACCRAAPILLEEAKDHIGENAIVRGLVEQVSFSKKGNAFLNFGGRYLSRSSPDSCRCKALKFLQSLAGNPVTVTGRIEL